MEADKDTPKYLISNVAEQFNLHPQTLRAYERHGLVIPRRSGGNTRLYSENDLIKIRRILTLTRDMGINLAGVEVILRLQDKIHLMQNEFFILIQQMQSEMDQIDKRFGERMRTMLSTTSLKHITVKEETDENT